MGGPYCLWVRLWAKAEGYTPLPSAGAWSMLTGKTPEKDMLDSHPHPPPDGSSHLFLETQFPLFAARGPPTHCHGPMCHVLGAGDIDLIT